MDYITYAVCWRLALTVIKSAIRVIGAYIVRLKVTLAMCGLLASTVNDSENGDDGRVCWTHRQLVRPNR